MRFAVSFVPLVLLISTTGCMSIMPALAPGVEHEENISAAFPFESRFVEVRGSKMHYVEKGEGTPILMLHGNPTSSYLWRNVIPVVAPAGRVIAVDLIGMGKSDKPEIDYHLSDHIDYIEGFIDALELKSLVLVLHDWGGGIGLDYAMRNQDNVRGIVLMETIVRPFTWDQMDAPGRYMFQNLRDPETGHELIVDENYFVEKIVPAFSGRELSAAEMRAYRAPYLEAAHRKPVRQWPLEIPIDGEPARNQTRIAATYQKLKASQVPLLMLVAEPGAIMNAGLVATLKAELPRAQTKDIGPGLHYIQEAQPTNIGNATREWVAALPAPPPPSASEPVAGKRQ